MNEELEELKNRITEAEMRFDKMRQLVDETGYDWDMIELRWVADDATQGGKMARAMRVAGMFSEKQEYQRTSIIDVPASWDEFLAGRI